MRKFLIEETESKVQRQLLFKDTMIREAGKEYEDYMSDLRTGKIKKTKYIVLKEIQER